MENPSFIPDFAGFPYKKGGFSKARLVYQRVMMVINWIPKNHEPSPVPGRIDA